jgi:hypothetical protein
MIFSEDVKVLLLPNHHHTLKMGTELVPDTSENLHILTRLSVLYNSFEYRLGVCFKTYTF